MINKKIAIIGLGNMGRAIRDGILKKKLINKNQLFVSNKQLTNKIVVSQSEVLIVAVKPQVMKSVLEKIREVVSKNKLIISIAAGVEIKAIEKFLGKGQRIIRIMPNLGAKVNQSISCWVKNKNVSNKDIKILKKIFQSVGQEMELKSENLLDQVTAISGSGPAYFLYLTELLEKTAIKIGLDQKLSKILTKQTLISSAELFKNSNLSAENLRNNIASKGGTTEAAFEKIYNSKFENIFFSAIESAYNRAIKLHLKI